MASLALRRLIPALRSTGLSLEAIASGRHTQEFAYLLDRAGAGIGYRYKWDVYGPFSVDLAEDLGKIDELEAAELQGNPWPGIDEAAEKVTAIATPPAGQTEEAWLRLLVCVDFLKHRSKVSLENGETPPFVRRNFQPDQIREAEERVQELAIA